MAKTTPSPPVISTLPAFNADEDPDTYLSEASVAEVRAFEKRTRQNIELRKKELRSMVGEQYIDLISAADTIIDMDKKCKSIRESLDRMRTACTTQTIQSKAAELRSNSDQKEPKDDKGQQQYVLAALIKSLADVPKQIWHALESHQYLLAGSLYTLAEQVHAYLESEEAFTIDVDLAFPVIQRQWDAISFFRSQIIQKSMHHLRAAAVTSEDVAQILMTLVLLDGMTMESTLQILLDRRGQVIKEHVAAQGVGSKEQHARLPRQLRDMAAVIRTTLLDVYHVFVAPSGNELNMLAHYVARMQESFMIPQTTAASNPSSTSGHAASSPATDAHAWSPVVTRMFSPIVNAHLLIRHLPEEIHQFTPSIHAGTPPNADAIHKATLQWLRTIKTDVDAQLPSILKPLTTHASLWQVRVMLDDFLLEQGDKSQWQRVCNDVLREPYSIYDDLFRVSFNAHGRAIVDAGFDVLTKQPKEKIWPAIVNRQEDAAKNGFQLAPPLWPSMMDPKQPALQLPTLASSLEIESFKTALRQVSSESTPLLTEFVQLFDRTLDTLRLDAASHTDMDSAKQARFQSDVNALAKYFQEQCQAAAIGYMDGIQSLLDQLRQWSNREDANKLSIWLGRLAKHIGGQSQQLTRCLTLTNGRADMFELKSDVGKDPRVLDLERRFHAMYQQAHQLWMDWMYDKFEHQLVLVLATTSWDDTCPAAAVWERMSDGVVLPTVASHEIEEIAFDLCQAIQHYHCTRLEMTVLRALCETLHDRMVQVLTRFMAQSPVITEKGATQLLFDVCFIHRLLQEHAPPASQLEFAAPIKQKIDPINWATMESCFDDNVDRFYLKQTLLLGNILRTNNDSFERTRKAMVGKQQGQQQQNCNVVPLAHATPRFTLLPVGQSANLTMTG